MWKVPPRDCTDWTVSLLKSSLPTFSFRVCFSWCSIHVFSESLFWNTGSFRMSRRLSWTWGTTCRNFTHGHVLHCQSFWRRNSAALSLAFSSSAASFISPACPRNQSRTWEPAAWSALPQHVALTTRQVTGSGMTSELAVSFTGSLCQKHCRYKRLLWAATSALLESNRDVAVLALDCMYSDICYSVSASRKSIKTRVNKYGPKNAKFASCMQGNFQNCQFKSWRADFAAILSQTQLTVSSVRIRVGCISNRSSDSPSWRTIWCVDKSQWNGGHLAGSPSCYLLEQPALRLQALH